MAEQVVASMIITNPYFGNRRATLMEWNSPDAIIDIPFLYFDWSKGPLWVRVGNQVIAWGEAYFFRTMDVANGLDLRRRLVGQELKNIRINVLVLQLFV